MNTRKPHINPENVVDAEVVGEQPGHEHTHAQNAPMPHEGLTLFILTAVLFAAVFALAQQTRAVAVSPNPTLAALRTPVYVILPQASAITLAPARQQGNNQLVSFKGTLSAAQAMKSSAHNLSGTPGRSSIPPVGSRLTPESYNLMLAYLAQKEGITLESDARDILLQTGYTLPPAVNPPPQRKRKDHITFARDVVSALVKDEVESFLGKVRLVSEVGVYVAEQE